MALDSSLMFCAVAVGAGQVIDGFALRSSRGKGTTAITFSFIEWAWGGLCAYLLVSGSHVFPPWLAGIFVIQLAAWLLYVGAQAKRGRSIESFELTPMESMTGGAFGAFYATAAVVTWALLGG